MKPVVCGILIFTGLVFAVPSGLAKGALFVIAGIVAFLAWPSKRKDLTPNPVAANANEFNTEHEPINGHQYRKLLAAQADPLNVAYTGTK